ncbi:hypothetical protein [Mariniblastus fucicola]|uniref:TIGR03545 family protein n=1 Tax=Mariniblastus fucicola TaxID=980251 RepID=A0A5B9PL95_9BACT|nr:hypothetical protein [Mariniblastus fucicola]QEG23451.1 hypothetical protein MFFC18_33500 [Mariniblastus fucicola]
MKRLNQLITRLLIIALVALAAWVGRAHLGKQALVYHLQSYVGARVDARQLHLNAEDATVFLNQVEVASPLHDRKNLLQFEAASLKVDLEALKKRQLVINEGRLSQIKFGSPRTTSGKLERGLFDPPLPLVDESSTEATPPAGVPQSYDQIAGYPAAQKWRDSLIVDVSQTASSEVSSFEIGKTLTQKSQLWVDRFRDPHKQMAHVEKSLTLVEEILSMPVDQLNPLRSGDDKLKDAVAAIDSSRKALEKVGASITEFESQSQKDIYDLSQVQVRDRQMLVSSSGTQKFDSKLINELLIGDIQRKLVANGLDWFQEFRTSLPNPEADFRPLKRGRDVHFAGQVSRPKIEIKKLQIDGAAEFANSHFRFAGTIENLLDDPTKSEHPLTFNFRAQGDPQVIVSGMVDQSRGKKVDSIHFTGHAIPQPAYTLGSNESIQLSMTGDSRLFVDADLNADANDQLGGSITFTFEDVMLHADSVHESAGGAGTAARLNETVSGIQSFRITSTLGGTIYQPTTTFASDLGPQVAASLESVFRDAQQLAQKKKEHRLNKTVEGDLVQLKSSITDGIASLNESWRANYSRLNRLSKRLSTARGPQLTRPNKLR